MKLETYTSGTGDRTVLLVHGSMSSHKTWHAVEAELVRRDYRVVSVDMRGHGASPRGDYSVAALGDDLADSLPTGADVAVGHSMGGVALSLAVERLCPARAVYVDPAFRQPGMWADAGERMRRLFAVADTDHVRERNPRWSDADVESEVRGFASFDPEFFDFVAAEVAGNDFLPAKPVVPSLVLRGGNSVTVTPQDARELEERGFTVRVVEDAGHCVHRDDLPGFLAALEGWL
ncbi:pimeloyl-ACP methyl ester carboxylesterase [Nocardiopsis arvandica]|uniref:Pimeloyl-ACP methyl ester carboxylesterase n=1 Tax=Nocardiopsis sinuspersici TaxID=501010 RepID=A0A7Y9XEZ9_9ACTN|nr:alpha/beta hydrolase [Nocardiopsis sinuspersici]NYH53577.1 pimeloyl-ACP methyl ester carboxylesterase [Nocardiopsis sinuspersici]